MLTVIEKMLVGDDSSWLFNTEKIIIEIVEIIQKQFITESLKNNINNVANLLIDKGFLQIRDILKK
ncbi:hypothetical protein LCGC14_0832910 [marine sediment metagenome]|uniref:Uncharacterized protein n=1 Tax=marine sediment metagenome TaxID=412755 RepID=A0A0F9SMN6_9ZZZZ